MIELRNIQIEQVAVHEVGNRSASEDLVYSNAPIDLADEKLTSVLLEFFLSSFSGNEMYRFHNEVGLEQNEMYVLAKRIFDNKDDLFAQSKIIAQHLYNCSDHPKVKGGELYVAYLKDIIIDNEMTDAIGLFKSEHKEDYLKVAIGHRNNPVRYDEGTNVNKLDKGCLIFDLEADNGYKVCIIDNLNKATEAVYWKDEFLSIIALQNEYHQTNQFLDITKQFVTKQLAQEYEVTKTDKIDLLNRSVAYFKNHDRFDKEQFEEEVFYDNDLRDSFRKFDNSYREENAIDLSDDFAISTQAVKRQARVFKSVLKLDKNFHIYIHGDKQLIEHGVEPDGRKFYKIYYEEES